MDKNAIKKYAVWARRELIERVSQRALVYGITAKDAGDPNAESVNGHLLSQAEKRQRQALIRNIKEKSYEQVMEDVAYTWFNRFAALRFMEVNGYLPSHIRVFTNDAGEFKPQILAEAIHLELDGLDMNKVYELESANKSEELFKYLLIVQCNALNSILPGMFQRIEDYTELLLPDYLLREGSVIEQMVTTIPEADWTDQVQIIGWLYQYYNIEPKDKAFADLKKNIKITKENIPAATQLFTPDWIVHYMVENSLGRLWLEGHPNNALKSEWKYYLDEAEQEPEVQAQLATIRKEYAALKPEEIRVIDPCMGSGHILCVLFDVLVRIYEDYGYTAREAAVKIVENNLWGLDIDERAAQLSYFAVMMKARQYDRRFFAHPVQPNVYAIQESNWIGGAFPFDMGDFLLSKEHQETLNYLISSFHDAKEYGSILQLEQRDYAEFIEAWELTASQTAEKIGLLLWYDAIKDAIPELAKIATALTQKYQVVCTNPPYMAVSNGNGKLQNYVKKNFPDSKADLFAVFIERCGQMTGQNGYQAMITQHAWMFLASFEKLRGKLLLTDTVNMAHLGARAFEEIGGEVVQTSSFVLRKSHTSGYKGVYCRLVEPTTQQSKEDMFLSCENRYTAAQDNFSKIPGSPVAYWVSQTVFSAFNNETIGKYAISDGQTKTGNNDKYLRLIWEVERGKTGRGHKWVLHAKGGPFRRWYGNIDTLIDWSDEARNHYRSDHVARIAPEYIWFRKGICWTLISSSPLHGFRILEDNSTFNLAAPSVFFNDENMMYYILGFLNTKFSNEIISLFNPTLNTNISDITSQPLIYYEAKQKDTVINIVKDNISLSRSDWDSFETSWDFQRHPLLPIAEDGIGIFGGMKVGEKRWIMELRNGSACFSPVEDFIKQGEKTGNNEQGDKYEGVFARLKKGSPKIAEMETLLGDDLEQICDGEYILLRRKSSKTVPVLCFYGFFKEDAEIVQQTDLGNGKYQLKLRLTPSEKMFDDFLNESTDYSDKKETWGMGFSVGHFQKSIESALDKKGIVYKPVKVSYDIFDSEEFFIEPGQDYPELKHKAKRLSYQKEIRWILPETHRQDKLIVPYTTLSNHSAGTFEEGSYFEFDVEGHAKGNMLISSCFAKWEVDCETRFQALKANEEELNRIFIDIYGMQDELTPEVEDKDVTVRKADLRRDIRSFVSYAVGCMFGRYSLDEPGLAYAGGVWDAGKYKTFPADKDNIIPICDDEYFEDDIVSRFVEFVETVYGADTLDENLKFISNALGGKGQPKDVIRSYFLNDFFNDHCKIYQKRPIYWQFDSGKKNGFKCLIYMHRYQPDTIARIRTDYVHEQQSRYRTAIADLEQRINGASTSERVKLSKQLAKLQAQAEEIRVYEEKIHHLADQMIKIDLDDGVKHNYEIFKDVLAKIK